MVERQRRPFGKDHNVLAPSKRHWYVCLTNSRKMRFPLFRTTALPSRRPTTIPTRVFPRQDRQETHVKELRRDALAFPFYSLEVLFFFQE